MADGEGHTPSEESSKRDFSSLEENSVAGFTSRILLAVQGGVLLIIAVLVQQHMDSPPILPLVICYTLGAVFVSFALFAPRKWCIWLAGGFPWYA